MSRITYPSFDHSIDLTIAALQRHDPKILTIEDFGAQLGALKDARLAIDEAVERAAMERRRIERAERRYADVLRRVASVRQANRIAKAKQAKINKAEWRTGVAKIMDGVRARESWAALGKPRFRVPAVCVPA